MISKRVERSLEIASKIGPDAAIGAYQYFFVRMPIRERRLCLDEISDAWRTWRFDTAAGRLIDTLHFYLHVPFCSHRCSYCVYYSLASPEPAMVSAWFERLERELPFWAEMVESGPLSTMYIGGGTPTVLEVEDLRRLLGMVRSNFRVRPGGERSFECNPLTATDDKAAVFREAGFNRVSFGIQNMHPEVLRGVNRGYQTVARTDETFRIMHDAGFHINIDLIQGLPGEPPDSIKESMRWVFERRPAEITLHRLLPTTPSGILDRSTRKPLKEVALDIGDLAASSGYSVMIFDTVIKLISLSGSTRRDLLADEAAALRQSCGPDSRVCFYSDVPDEPSSVLAIGPDSRSQILGGLRYRMDRYEPGLPFDGHASIAVGHGISRRDAQSQFVVGGLCRRRAVDLQAFQAAFGEPLEAVFGDSMRDALDAGLLVREGDLLSHASQDWVTRFGAEMLFVSDQAISAADEFKQRYVNNNPGAVGLVVSAGPTRFTVKVFRGLDDARAACRAGDYAFVVPSSPDEGARDVRALGGLFARFFERVVRVDNPDSLDALVSALLTRGSGIRLVASADSVLNGAVMKVERLEQP